MPVQWDQMVGSILTIYINENLLNSISNLQKLVQNIFKY